MRAQVFSSGNTKDTRNLLMVPRWDVVGRLWSVRVTIMCAWCLVQNREATAALYVFFIIGVVVD